MEIWKTITDYPNYQVSNYGNVKNIRFNRIFIHNYINGKFKAKNRRVNKQFRI